MNTIDDKEIDLTDKWYHYAAKQTGFVGQALALVRNHTSQSEEEQRSELSADHSSFVHLQGMPRPRARMLIADANRIAEECGISNPLAFVRAMILAYKIEDSNLSAAEETYYQAAFDEREDIDSYPDED